MKKVRAEIDSKSQEENHENIISLFKFKEKQRANSQNKQQTSSPSLKIIPPSNTYPHRMSYI